MFYESIMEAASKAAQKEFDDYVKPYIIQRMRKLGISRIEHIMGVDFYTTKRGQFSGSELAEQSQTKAALVDTINTIKQKPLYSLINWDINLPL